MIVGYARVLDAQQAALREAGAEQISSRVQLVTCSIAKAGAGFKSLADAWADTTTAHG